LHGKIITVRNFTFVVIIFIMLVIIIILIVFPKKYIVGIKEIYSCPSKNARFINIIINIIEVIIIKVKLLP